MLRVEQLRRVRPDQVAAVSRALAAKAEHVNAVIADTTESAGRDLADWHGRASAASTAHRHTLADDALRLREAHTEAATVISDLADRLDEARQLLNLADSFATLVGCQVYGAGEVTALPPTMLGPLATVYDSVRRTAASLAAQALVVAEAADRRASAALGEAPRSGPDRADTGTVAAGRPGAEEAGARSAGAIGAGRHRADPHRVENDQVGAQLAERYAVNRALIEANRAELRHGRTEMAATPAADRTVASARTLDAINHRIGTLNSFLASRTLTTIDPATGTRRTLRSERQFLAFEPSGSGRVAEVFGTLSTARSVAVLVPGGRNGLDTFNALATDAKLLADTAGGDTAVVAWLGYDSTGAVIPGAAEQPAAAEHTRARAGGLELRRFLAGLMPSLAADVRLVVVGHGFGTVLVAAALRAGHTPADVVLVGSPGLGPRIRSAADLRPARPHRPAEPAGPADGEGPRVWAVRSPGDTIAYSRACGADPSEFTDATRLETQGGAEVVGHARYYAVGSESLDNLARVVAGRLAEVTVTDTTLEEEMMLAGLDEPAASAPTPPTASPDGALNRVGGVGV